MTQAEYEGTAARRRETHAGGIGAWERVALVVVLLAAWWLRWVALMEVPPGWRDDDLIEIYTFSLRVAEEGPVLYFVGASGHEPFYHTIRAPLIVVAGINQASARWLSATVGTLAVLLTWAVGRRIFSSRTGVLGAALVAFSFWALMYSRVAVRHMAAPPWMLLAIYWGWRQLHDRVRPRGAIVGVGIGLGGSLLTYYAGRVMPVYLIGALILAAPRRQRWVGYLTGVVLGLLIAAPMFVAAIYLTGADARVSEVAVPLQALLEGDPAPVLRTFWTTLGMFHARGDPEWLYNYSERPVFGTLGAILFLGSLILHLIRWRDPAARWLLLWIGMGIAPAFISYPPSSLGHTIMALPAVHISLATLPDLVKDYGARLRPWRNRWSPAAQAVTAALVLLVVGLRDLPDYFVRWPTHSMVHFLYRGDYRSLASHLDAHPEIEDVAAGSMLFGPWDQLAVRTDLRRDDVQLRWLNPTRALVFADGAATNVYVQDETTPHPYVAGVLQSAEAVEAPAGMQGCRPAPPSLPPRRVTETLGGKALADQPFGDALALEAVAWEPRPADEGQIWVVTQWRVEAPLPLPPHELSPYPPPPGVYTGPRLKVFAHLLDGAGELIGVDDGLWVDPYSLVPGDLVVQVHEFTIEAPVLDEVRLKIGLYDPLNGERWITSTGEDNLTVRIDEG